MESFQKCWVKQRYLKFTSLDEYGVKNIFLIHFVSTISGEMKGNTSFNTSQGGNEITDLRACVSFPKNY